MKALARAARSPYAVRQLGPVGTSCRFSSPTSSPTTSPSTTPSISPRILTEIRDRVGACIRFGLRDQEQTDLAGKISEDVGRDWRELIAGSEGYLTSMERRGLFRHAVVWGDMDSMGHVNNVVHPRLAESARVNWAANYATYIDPKHSQEWSELWTSRSDGMILKSINVDFKFPMKFPDHVTVYHKLRSLPTETDDSFRLDVLILSEKHQRPASRCLEDIVLYDYRKGKKISLGTRPFMLEAFRETFKLQQEASTRNIQKCRDLLKEVESLEKSSWDRDGAVEDVGGNNP